MSDSTEKLSPLQLAELMASKLCHDLVGPVGATANGAELLADMTMEDEALALTSASANQATRILQYYRLAFGASGALRNDYDELRSVAEGWLKLRDLNLTWNLDAAEDVPLGATKLLANLIGVAAEALPRGGEVEGGIRSEDGMAMVYARAAGNGAQFRSEALGALDPASHEELTPRGVQAYYAAVLAVSLGGSLTQNGGDSEVLLQAHLPVQP